MALIISGSGPAGGTISPGMALADRLAAIPDFAGAWFAEDPPPGAVSNWQARYGTAALVQPTPLKQPVKSNADGIARLEGGAGITLSGVSGFTIGGAATIGMRFFFDTPDVDLQFLFALSGGTGASPDYAVYRSGSKNLIIDKPTDVSMSLEVGWHTLFYSQSGTETIYQLDDTVVTAANPGIGGQNFVLYNRTANATSQGFRGDISRLFIARSAVPGTGPNYNAVMTVLNG